MKTVLATALFALAACGPYDAKEAEQAASATEAQRVTSIDPRAQHRHASGGYAYSNRIAGAELAKDTDYYHDPATGLCFAALNTYHGGGISVVDCAKVKHMLLNPPPE